MLRIAVVVALVALFAVGHLFMDRRRAAIADRSGIAHPTLPADLVGPERTWIVFATRYCATCGPVTDRLRALHTDQTVHKILVEERPELAAEYQVRTAPTVLEVDAAGTVVRSIAGAEPVLAYVSELAAV